MTGQEWEGDARYKIESMESMLRARDSVHVHVCLGNREVWNRICVLVSSVASSDWADIFFCRNGLDGFGNPLKREAAQMESAADP